MSGLGRTAAQLRRLPPLVWVLAFAIVLVGLVAALGGFAPAADRGRLVGPGDEVLTSRWRIQVDNAALVDDTPTSMDPQPMIRVRLRTEFLGDTTLCCMSERMLEVRYAGQSVTEQWKSDADLRSTGGFDPGVEVARVIEFPLEARLLPTRLPSTVEVVVRGERRSRSPIFDDWLVADAVASVRLDCPDERTRR